MQSHKRKQKHNGSNKVKKVGGQQSKKEVDTEGIQMETDFLDDIESEHTLSGSDSDIEVDEPEQEKVQGNKAKKQVYLPTDEAIDEKFEYENSAYSMLHKLTPTQSCLSFCFLPDALGAKRTRFPHSVSFASGTQSEDPLDNNIILHHASKLHKTKHDKEFSDSESEMSTSSEHNDEDAIVSTQNIKHTGSVNKIVSYVKDPIISTFSDSGHIYIFDIAKKLTALDPLSFPQTGKSAQNTFSTPISCHKGKTEGWGLAFSTLSPRLCSGDCAGNITVHDVSASTLQRQVSYNFADTSIEAVEWSPTEGTVFTSGSTDGMVRIFDTRSDKPDCMLSFQPSKTDVNCVAWNHKVPYLLATGSDDGYLKVFDLRKVQKTSNKAEVGFFDWHKQPVTGLSWNPFDESVIAVSSDDNTVTLWDLALERDDDSEDLEIPPQLLFIHGGVTQAKDVQFHPQVEGLMGANGVDGMHLFIPEPLEKK